MTISIGKMPKDVYNKIIHDSINESIIRNQNIR